MGDRHLKFHEIRDNLNDAQRMANDYMGPDFGGKLHRVRSAGHADKHAIAPGQHAVFRDCRMNSLSKR